MLNRDQTGKKKETVSLDTFLVKAISKAPPSASYINLQDAIAEAYCVLLLWYIHYKGLKEKQTTRVSISSCGHSDSQSYFRFLSLKSPVSLALNTDEYEV